MEFEINKAKEIAEKYGLSDGTIKTWAFRNSIPDKYADNSYVPVTEHADKAGKIVLTKMKELIDASVISFRSLCAVSGIDYMRFYDATRSDRPINETDIEKLRIEIKKLRVQITNTFETKSTSKLEKLFSNKLYKHTAILGDKTYFLQMQRYVKKGDSVSSIDYMRIKDAYMKASLLMMNV